MSILRSIFRGGLGIGAFAAFASSGVAGDADVATSTTESTSPPATSTLPSAIPEPPGGLSWVAADVDALPDDAWGRAVRYGRDLIVETASLIGPEVADPTRRYAGNNLNCQNCHLEAGTKRFGNPFQGVYAVFPTYSSRSGQVATIEDRVQGCMTRSMTGRPLPPDGPEMSAIVAYLRFLPEGS